MKKKIRKKIKKGVSTLGGKVTTTMKTIKQNS